MASSSQNPSHFLLHDIPKTFLMLVSKMNVQVDPYLQEHLLKSGKIIGIYGASGFGREVAPVVSSNLRGIGAEVVFIDDNAAIAGSVNDRPIYNWAKFLALDALEKSVVIAVADAHVRSLLVDRCREQMIQSFDVVATNVFIGDEVAIGEGHILQPFVTLTSNISIGRYFHANIYSYVAHDCKIGDFVTFAPWVS